MNRAMVAKYTGDCLAGRGCLHGGKVHRGSKIVWYGSAQVVHQGICEDRYWKVQFAAREAEQEREVYTIKMNRDLQSTHWGRDPRGVMAP